ncbi:MAG: BlaI/MecI/CopY family transcriptional regulator [Actinobacteria bacterium]|jgi:predicted transcriptional regulator|nr:BlaI/MecI/CopY family transcriptional regulator [Actinomycetota bacterium]
MAKRPDGALEYEILSVLWASDVSLQPGDIKDRLTDDLAYTSVATVLGRLLKKGLVERDGAGRAFAYRAIVDESELASRRINDVLTSSSDRSEVLAGFVNTLSKGDAAEVLKLLDTTQLNSE